MAISPNPTTPADPLAAEAAKLQAELSGDGVSANVDTSPAPVSPAIDPASTLSQGETIVVPASQVNTSATPINAITPGLQTFDDGSSIQTFDDGSTLVTDSNGKISSTPETLSLIHI